MRVCRVLLVLPLVLSLSLLVSCGGGGGGGGGFGAEAILQVNDGTSGWELGKIVNGQLSLIKDIYPGTENSYPRNFTLYKGKVYFEASDGVTGINGPPGGELWVTDGTEAGTKLVKDIRTIPDDYGSRPEDFTVYNGKLYFTAAAGSTRELWVTDGTEAGTQKVDLYTDMGLDGGFRDLFVYGGMLYHVATHKSTGENRIFRTDGVTVEPLFDTENPGHLPTAEPPEHKYVFATYSSALFTILGNDLYFIAGDSWISYDIWKTDGAAASAVRVTDIREIPGEESVVAQMAVVGDNLMLIASVDSGSNYKAWASDGETATPRVLSGATSFQVPPAIPIFIHNGVVYFRATDGTSGYEPWTWNGVIDAGTGIPEPAELLADLNSGAGYSRPDGFLEFDGKVFFTASTGLDTILFSYDPVGDQLVEVTNPTSHPELNYADLFAESYYDEKYLETSTPGALYFAGTTTAEGGELWASDGTPAGTALVEDFNVGAVDGLPID